MDINAIGNTNVTLGENTTTDEDYYTAWLTTRFVIISLFGLVIFMGIVGNIIVLLLIILEKPLHTTVNKCLFVLGMADLLLLIILPTMPISHEFLDDDSHIGKPFCYFLSFYDRGAPTCSILIFCFVSVDRYYAIYHPLKSRRYWSGRKTYIVLATIWVISAVFSIPYMYINVYEESVKGNITHYYCYFDFNEDWKLRYDFAMNCAPVFLPIPGLIYGYGRMIIALKKKVPGETTGEADRGRQQVMVMLMVVVFIFVVCQMPFAILVLLDFASPNIFTFNSAGKVEYFTIWFARTMIYVNSAINPAVYFSVSSKFREAFMVVFCCRKEGWKPTSIDSRSTYLQNASSSKL